MPFRIVICLLGLLSLVATGCGQEGPRMYDVRGQLTHQGQPIPQMTVIFRPENLGKHPESSATTDAEGRFVMRVGSTEGVAPGKHTVFVQDPAALHGAQTSDDPAYQAVLQKYGSPKTSPYTITVEDDLGDLELKLD